MKNKIMTLFIGMFIIFSMTFVLSDTAPYCQYDMSVGTGSNAIKSTTSDSIEMEFSVSTGTAEQVYAGLEYRESGTSSWTQATSTFEWYTNPNYPMAEYPIKTITGLNPNTEYDVRPVIIQYEYEGLGYSYICQSASYKTVYTDALQQPDVYIEPVTNLDVNSVTLNADITLNDASNFEIVFQLRKSGENWQTLSASESTINSNGIYSYDVTGLDAGTLYDYRAYYSYTIDMSIADYTSSASFTTGEATVTTPTISLNPVGSITDDQGVLSGTLSSLGDYTSVNTRFYYKETSITGPIAPISASEQTLSSTGDFTYTLSGLSADTSYTVNVGFYNTDTSNWEYADTETTFTTSTVTYDWINTTKQTITTNNTAFDESLSGLDTNSTYVYKACVETVDDVTCDAETTFTTLSLTPPSIQTLNATSISDSSATLNGELLSMGDYSEVNVEFAQCINTTCTSLPSQQTLTSTGTFSYILSDLTYETNYSYRALAYSPSEYFIEGDIVDFKTTEISLIPPSETQALSNVTMNFTDDFEFALNDYYTYYDTFEISVEGMTTENGTISPLSLGLGETGTITDGENNVLTIELYEILSNRFLKLTSYETNQTIDVNYVVSNSAGNITDTFTVTISEGATTSPTEPPITEESDNIFTKVTDFFIELLPNPDEMSTVQKITFISIILIIVSIIITAVTLKVTGSLSIGVIYLIAIIDTLLIGIFTVLGYIPIGFVIAVALAIGITGFFKIRGGMQ